eukprot:IDg4155t1
MRCACTSTRRARAMRCACAFHSTSTRHALCLRISPYERCGSCARPSSRSVHGPIAALRARAHSGHACVRVSGACVFADTPYTPCWRTAVLA